MAAFLDGVTKVSDETAERLRQHWDDGWNRGDVAVIMEPFADGIVFSSPFVSKLGPDPTKATVDGYAALEAYVTAALERSPGIQYTVDRMHVGTDTIVLEYTVHFPDGRPDARGADLMLLDDDERVIEWRSHYEHGS